MSKEELLILLMLYGLSTEKMGAVLVAEIIEQIDSGVPVIKSIDNALVKTGFIKGYFENLIETVCIAAYLGHGISSKSFSAGNSSMTFAPSTPNISVSKSQKMTSSSTSTQLLTDNVELKPAIQQIKTAKELAMERGLVPRIIIGDGIKDKILSESWTADKINLSTRLHGTEVKMRQAIVDTLSAGMRQGKTVKDMAMDLYDGYNSGKKVINNAELPDYLQKLKSAARSAANGDRAMTSELNKAIDKASSNIEKLSSNDLKAAYKQVLDAAKDLNIKVMEKAAWVAVQEKSRYYADRISATEMSRAWSEGFFAKNANDPRVIGYKWSLSPNHPRFDICDFHATANLYGMGPGCYPKNKVPSHPAHPYCHCNLSVIFKGEAEIGEFNANAGKEWLQKQSEYDRQQLLGIEGNKAFEKGGNWQEYLRNWNGHGDPQSRFVAKDFELQLSSEKRIMKAELQVRNEIKNGSVKLEINPEKQNRHVYGHQDWKDYIHKLQEKGSNQIPSVLTVDAQELINKYAGTGYIRFNRKGEWNQRETITSDSIVGFITDDAGQKINTKTFSIRYSKTGTHIVPIEEG